jgi:dynein regulatory complex protein 1
LEKEMQILEKCMEDMKAVYRLNEEKLDFNTRVLDERSEVNRKSEVMLKKRKNRYKVTL